MNDPHRAPRAARSRRAPAGDVAEPSELPRERPKRRRGLSARFLLASCAVLGIGGALTAAAWVESVAFEADSTVRGFRMEYSFDTVTWRPFPGNTLTLTQWPSVIEATRPAGQHSIFVRNTVSTGTLLSVTPELTGVMTEPGFITVRIGLNGTPQQMEQWMHTWTSGTVDQHLTPSQVGRVDLAFSPSALGPYDGDRTGTLSVSLSGVLDEPTTLSDDGADAGAAAGAGAPLVVPEPPHRAEAGRRPGGRGSGRRPGTGVPA